MKLETDDKIRIMESGYTESDFAQIEMAMQKSKTSYTLKGERISRERAIELLGRETYIFGISKSAFHYTAAMESSDGEILFDSGNLFRG